MLSNLKISGKIIVSWVLVVLSSPGYADENVQDRMALSVDRVPGGQTRLSTPFQIGVEFMSAKGASASYGSIGVKWAKTAKIEWNEIEPQPPVNGVSVYHFDNLDNLIREWQQSGVEHIQVWLACNAAWATRNPSSDPKNHQISTPPRNKEMMKAYGNFIRALVQRYDLQNEKHVSGLLYSVTQFEIESEAQRRSSWLGSSQEYLELLASARVNAKKTNPKVEIIASGMAFQDLFDDLPASDEIERRRKSSPELDAELQFNETVLKQSELFEIVEFHYHGDYLGAYGATQWIKAQLPAKDRDVKKIWAGDAYSAPVLRFAGTNFNPLVQQPKAAELIKALKETVSPTRTSEIKTWYQKKQAALLVKKLAVGMHAGLTGMNLGNTSDWWQALNQTIALGMDERLYNENRIFMGLMEFSPVLNNTLGEPRLAYKALIQSMLKIPSATSITRLKGPKGVFAYRLDTSGWPTYLAWYETSPYSLPEGKEFRVGIRGRIGSKMATVLPIIPEPGMPGPRFVPAQAGRIPLSENPVWIQGLNELEFENP